jgi:predicted aconitase
LKFSLRVFELELTTEEKAILGGAKGEGAALAMKILVGIGEAFDAPCLIPITRAHVALSNQEADLWFAEKLTAGGARCVIPPTVNPGYCLEFFPPRGMTSEEDDHLMERTRDAYQIGRAHV